MIPGDTAPLRGRYVVAMLAGEHIITPHVLSVLRGADLIVAADGGMDALARAGIKPDRLMGDMDSVDPSVLEAAREAGVEEWHFPVRKDDSDGALVLQALADAPYDDKILYGAMGTRRSDHMLGNLMQAVRLVGDGDIHGRIWLSNGIEYWWITKGPVHVALQDLEALIPDVARMTVSVVPMTAITGYTTRGMDYAVEGIRLEAGTTRALSNRMTDEAAEIRWEDGLGILCVTSDERP